MDDAKQSMQADGGGVAPKTPQGHEEAGGGESGGGAYNSPDVQDGDNVTRKRPVETGRKPKP